MHLSEIYENGQKILSEKDYGFTLQGVETGFVLANNRRILDRYTFYQRCIDGVDASTDCHVLGVALSTPVIMSAMTMPISAIAEDGMMLVAEGLKASGSMMWTGTPLPKNLKALVDTGVPLAASTKPYKDRAKMFQSIEAIQKAGATWVSIEIDVGQGTKIKDRPMVGECVPLSLAELKEVRRAVSIPLILKGVLSQIDAVKAIEAEADGIVISNHGAHTIDYLPHPLQVMDEIQQLASGQITVMVDGGFRRGSDVLKGLAFGASLVGLGRPILWALAADGRQGVQSLIEQITEELRRIMCMVGASTPGDTRQDMLIEDKFLL